MNIQKYQGYFHDGILVDIQQENDNVTIALISSQISPVNLLDDTIRGKLHLDNIEKIVVDGSIRQTIKMQYDNGDLFGLEIEEHKVTLVVIWQTLRPIKRIENDSKIEIEAKKINWENIPNMLNPFWFKEPGLHEYKNRAHYHHLNTDAKGRHDKYFDKNGMKVAQGSLASCLAPSKLNTIPSKEVSNKFIPEIPISEYSLEFHDGVLINIEQSKNNIVMTLMSAEIKPEVTVEKILLSNDRRIKGKLHFNNVLRVLKNGFLFTKPIVMKNEFGDVSYIKFISSEIVEISLSWETYSPHFRELGGNHFQIEAKKIYWESLPNLED
ncbi:hypothetical protein [Criblamydia sequanensis]|uniref:Uncharacterized protein n=1 Tax=Candidatus Criblamydia sequanensis CRIB-18 TaxID=1437425 RepID=A0A090CY15_9BACT|nr:hypothetical protein [Criblamydia sequanensis]CDR33197.1 hypothetical protein CSEC_0358 [Criblamydia sequanensis CRIB-18]